MEQEVFKISPCIVVLPGHFQGTAVVVAVDVVGGIAGFYAAENLGVVPYGGFDVAQLKVHQRDFRAQRQVIVLVVSGLVVFQGNEPVVGPAGTVRSGQYFLLVRSPGQWLGF